MENVRKNSMRTVRFWEEVNANVWPAFDHLLFDGWLLRFTSGYSRNSNSVWPLYEGLLPLESKIKFCEAQYSGRGLSPGFRLSEIPGHTAIEEKLIELGYANANPNLVMIRPIAEAPEGRISELPLETWLETSYQIHPTDDPHIIEWERLFLMKISLPSRFAVVKYQGRACGYGRSVLFGNILNLEKLWMLPELRDQGLGTQLIQGLLGHGCADGADIAYLTVNQSNTDAQQLYTRLGFETRYTYRYLVPRAEAD